jgi:quinoprotein glucose dehydrogenase
VETRSATDWIALAVGIVMISVGAVFCCAVMWHMPLHYLPSGFGMVVSGLLLCKRRVEGAWIYLLAFVLIIVAAWSQGVSNGWFLALRLAIPIAILILVLTIAPKLREYRYEFEAPATICVGLLLLVGAAILIGVSSHTSVTFQQPPSGTRMDEPAVRNDIRWPAHDRSLRVGRSSHDRGGAG